MINHYICMLKKNISFFLAILALMPFKMFAQQNPSVIVGSLDSIIRPITTLRGDTDFSDIEFLKETLKDKELIGLGEVTHGTAEVFNYKDRLVRFLVVNLGYRAIAFESDFMAIENMDNYITGKADSIVYLSGTAIMMSNAPMIEWLRKYNQGVSELKKVHIYGLESRNYTNIFTKLLSVVPDLTKTERLLMEDYLKRPFNSLLTKPESQGVKSMLSRFQSLKLPALERQYFDMLQQLFTYGNKLSNRDSYMAKNAQWIKERVKDNKLIVWAHNGHLEKVGSENYPTLGTHLDKKYASKYYLIGTDFNSGKAYVNVFIAKNRPLSGFQPYPFAGVKSEKWYEYFFSQCRYKNFILDIDTACEDPILKRFLAQRLLFRCIGALSIPDGQRISISRNFDLIVYFDKATSI